MFERLLKLSIYQRGLILVAVAVMAGFGIYNYLKLPIDAVPDITNVQVQINTNAPGYTPLEAEQRITFPIEMAMSGLPNLEYTRSLSRYGLSQVTVIFKDGTDIYLVRQLVSQRIQEVRSRLPVGIVPTMGPISTGLGEIFMWTVDAEPGARKPDGTPYTSMDLRELQDWVIKPRMRMVKGVTEVNSVGGYVKQYHVAPYPEKLLAVGLTLQDLILALERNNLNVGAGYIEKSGEQYLVRVPGQVANLIEIGEIILGSNQGVPIRVKNVADVLIGKELRTGAATQNGHEVVLGTAFMLMGENSRVVSQAAAEKLIEINRSLPAGVSATAVYDRTTLVDKTISTVSNNLLEGAALVIVVLFISLGNLRAALITALIIPLSMLFTISGMVASNVSANLLSLGALDFGIIVDGAVIIVENCIRRLSLEQQKLQRQLTPDERFEIVFDASKEVRRALLFGQIIIMVVYLPVFALSGVEGKMFHPMAFTVLLALLGAVFLSVTFVPAAVAMFLSGKMMEKEGAAVQWAKTIYAPALDFSLNNKGLTVTVAVVIVILSLLLTTRMGSEFIPSLDEEDIALHALRIPGTSLSTAIDMQNELEHTIKQFTEVSRVFSKIGTAEIATDPMPPSVADIFIIIKPQSEWSGKYRNKEELIAALDQAVRKIPGNNFEFTQPIEMRFNELISGVRADVGIKVFGDDLDVMLTLAEQIEKIVKAVPGAADVRIEQITGLPVLSVQMNREKMARYGLNGSDVQDAINIAIGGRTTGLIFEGDRRFELQVRLPEQIRSDIEALKRLPIKLPALVMPGAQNMPMNPMLADGQNIQAAPLPVYVALGEVADLYIAKGPNQVSRENGKRRVVVTANVRGRDIGSFVMEAEKKIEQQVKIPPGYWLSWGGQFEQLLMAADRLKIVIPLALGLVFFLLYTMLGSMRDSLLVFSAVPLAITGGIIALWLRDIPLSISAGVGFIAMSGVAVLDGLVLLSFIRDLRQQGLPLQEAIRTGSLLRLRPVLITTWVESLGFLPMALSTTTGAEVQRTLATVMIGSTLSQSLLSLLVVPVLYLLVHRNSAGK
ncbi:efflux RND transporter permease subunit [Nitrosomonas sp. wSCUT-2]